MKTLFKKSIWIIVLGMFVANTPVRADDDADFNQIHHAFKYWLKETSLLNSEGFGTNEFQNYLNLVQVAFDQILSDPSSGWKAYRRGAYNKYTGYETAVGQAETQLDNLGKKKVILTAGFYFIYKGSLESGPRLILEVGSKYQYFPGDGGRSTDYAKIYYPKSGGDAAKEFKGILNEYLVSKNIYRGGILEFSQDGRLQFLTNMEAVGKITWEDLIAAEKLKTHAFQNTEGYLRMTENFKKLGMKTKKGVLLYGPPGTGKSLVGQVLIAGTLNGNMKGKVTFISMTARNLVYKFTAKALYEEAARLAPSVIFIEDIDLLGVKRTDKPSYETQRKEAILNEFLNGIDGAVDNNAVLTIGTTNRPEDVDPALRRAQRLGVHLFFGHPGFDERKQFFERFGRKMAVWDADVSIEWLAGESEKMSGADIVEAIRLTKQAAIQQGSFAPNDPDKKLLLKKAHFELAFKRIKESTGSDGDRSKAPTRSLAQALGELRALESQQLR